MDEELPDQLELAEDMTRASIVRFIEAEAWKFTKAAREVVVDADKRERLEDKASVLRTTAAYIARGDDMKVTT